jgi:hypothetical protein
VLCVTAKWASESGHLQPTEHVAPATASPQLAGIEGESRGGPEGHPPLALQRDWETFRLKARQRRPRYATHNGSVRGH